MVRIAINRNGARVFLPDFWEDQLKYVYHDDEFLEPVPYLFNENSPAPPMLWIERCGGGVGDIVHMLPALEDKIREFRESFGQFSRVRVAVMGPHLFLLKHLEDEGVELLDALAFGQQYNYLNALKTSREYVDALCPCVTYEHSVQFDVKKSRVENFYELMQVKSPIRHPRITLRDRGENPFPEDKKVIGLGLRSTERWRDWTFENWMVVATGLKKMGYFVITVDLSKQLPDIPAITDVNLTEATRQMSFMDGFICVDTGITYVAAGLGLTTFGLYGETNGHTLLEHHYRNGLALQVIRPDKCQRPCYLSLERGFYCNRMQFSEAATACMNEITPEMVLAAVEESTKYGELGSTRFYPKETRK